MRLQYEKTGKGLLGSPGKSIKVGTACLGGENKGGGGFKGINNNKNNH